MLKLESIVLSFPQPGCLLDYGNGQAFPYTKRKLHDLIDEALSRGYPVQISPRYPNAVVLSITPH